MKLSTLGALLAAATLLASCADGPAPMAPTAPTETAQTPQPTEEPPLNRTPPVPPSETARYRVTFDAQWSAASHPVDFPTSAHFSPLIGGTHNTSASFWREGALASTGIKDMAERGRTSPLDQEIGQAIATGTADRVFTNAPPDKSVGRVSFEIAVNLRFPHVTLVTMVAPSPDWFVGVSGLPLFDGAKWIEELSVDLDPWDAGTDSGQTFFSPDQVTSPPAAISRIVSAPLSPAGQAVPLGRFIFTRIG